MEGFNYEIKIENSPFEIEMKNMKLPSTSKVADFNISFKDDSICRMLSDCVNQSLIEKIQFSMKLK